MSVSISRDEWLKALADAGVKSQEDDQLAVTVMEFAATFDLPAPTARHQLELLVKAGKATRTAKRGRTPYGRSITYNAYRLV